MRIDDRTRWNKKYEKPTEFNPLPSQVLVQAERFLPTTSSDCQPTALDLAGGNGRHALWLAQLGFQTTLVDVSDKALELAEAFRTSESERLSRRLSLKLLQRDLLQDGLPPGQWDLIVSVLFLDRPLLSKIAGGLTPGGVLLMVHPTEKNLLRHHRPPQRFLLREGELPALVVNAGLEILHSQEGWLADGRHDAFIAARRSAHS